MNQQQVTQIVPRSGSWLHTFKLSKVPPQTAEKPLSQSQVHNSFHREVAKRQFLFAMKPLLQSRGSETPRKATFQKRALAQL